MVSIEWGQDALYENGLDRGVLYLEEGAVPWNGLVGLDEDAKGNVEETFYIDGQSVLVLQSRVEDFSGTIEAYFYPKLFEEYNGYSEQETYGRFGMCYRTLTERGYLLHLVYNARVFTSSRSWETMGKTPNPSTFKWDFSCIPIEIDSARATAHLIVDASLYESATKIIEDILYGTDTTNPRLPSPSELYELFESLTTLRITRFPDGTYSAKTVVPGILDILDDGTFTINAPTAVKYNDGAFRVKSY